MGNGEGVSTNESDLGIVWTGVDFSTCTPRPATRLDPANTVVTMSQAEVIKQLKVKTNSAKRLHKEVAYYEKEKEKEQARVDKMKEEGADASDLKQAVSQSAARSK